MISSVSQWLCWCPCSQWLRWCPCSQWLRWCPCTVTDYTDTVTVYRHWLCQHDHDYADLLKAHRHANFELCNRLSLQKRQNSRKRFRLFLWGQVVFWSKKGSKSRETVPLGGYRRGLFGDVCALWLYWEDFLSGPLSKPLSMHLTVLFAIHFPRIRKQKVLIQLLSISMLQVQQSGTDWTC